MGLLITLEVVLGFHGKAAVAEENLALAQPDHRQACDEWMEASEETVELVSSMWLNPHKGWRRACGRPLCTKRASHKKCPSSACLPSGNGRSRKYSRLLPTWVAFQAAHADLCFALPGVRSLPLCAPLPGTLCHLQLLLSVAPQLLGPSSSGFGSTLSFLPLGLGRVILAATHQFLFVLAKHYCLDIIISEITCHCLDRGRVGALQLRGSIMFIDTSCIMVHVHIHIYIHGSIM